MSCRNHPLSPISSSQRLSWLSALFRFLLLTGLVMLPPAAPAQISDAKMEALVEALRLAAPTPKPDAGLYSDWQIKPENIKRWSKSCLDVESTPEQFAADQELARRVLACVLRGVLNDQLAASNHNEIVAVQRTAAWWLTGDPEQYRSDSASDYTLKVLEAYLRFF